MIRSTLFFFIFVVSVISRIDGGLTVLPDEDDDFFDHPNLRISDFSEVSNLKELDSEFWISQAQEHILAKIKQQRNHNKAKNVILFLGDGMSVHTITATRSFIGSEQTKLSFEKFPYFGLSKTYCVDKQVADSACSATAYLTGVKGNYGTVGVNGQVPRYHCEAALNRSTHTESIAKWAQDAGKATGLVTTARVTHASPSGTYAHTANRDWENDEYVKKDKCDPLKNIDIAQQLVNWQVGKNLKVVLGGGRGEFRDKSMKDEEDQPGWRTDGKDLIKTWLQNKKSIGANASYVHNRKGLMSVDINKTDYLLGLFSPGHCPFHGDIARQNRQEIDPTLSEMTEKAIKMLQKQKEGFFLFVEGARIDMAHHETLAEKSLEDTAEFSRAVEKALNLTSRDDTLIVVTSDHSHTMTINGYQARGSDILGLAEQKGGDGLPYTTLSYANGPGYYNTYKKSGGGRRDLSKDEFSKNADYQYMATVPLDSETHGADDVGIFAIGPKAHYFVGNYEQNNIPMLMAYAAQIGPYKQVNV